MLYLDSSVLVKRYVKEKGSEAVEARCQSGERIFTSALSYAEVLAALGRKFLDRAIPKKEWQEVRNRFVMDWMMSLEVLALDARTMGSVQSLVESDPIRGADAVHLSAALWLRDMCRLVPEFARGDKKFQFGVSDKQLAGVAAKWGLELFNPEASP